MVTRGILPRMKTCTKCHAEKNEAGFHKDKSRRDGLRPWCKSCAAEYCATNSKKMSERSAKWQRANPDRVRETMKRYKASHPDKRRAWIAVIKAIRSGKIPRPSELKCADCRTAGRDYHHEDYMKPLDVVALCRRCHNIRHKMVLELLRASRERAWRRHRLCPNRQSLFTTSDTLGHMTAALRAEDSDQ